MTNDQIISDSRWYTLECYPIIIELYKKNTQCHIALYTDHYKTIDSYTLYIEKEPLTVEQVLDFIKSEISKALCKNVRLK